MIVENDPNLIINNITPSKEQPLLKDELVEIPITPNKTFAQLYEEKKSLVAQLEPLSTPGKIDQLSAVIKSSRVSLGATIFLGILSLISHEAGNDDSAKAALVFACGSLIASMGLCGLSGRYRFYNPDTLGDHAATLEAKLNDVNAEIRMQR